MPGSPCDLRVYRLLARFYPGLAIQHTDTHATARGHPTGGSVGQSVPRGRWAGYDCVEM